MEKESLNLLNNLSAGRSAFDDDQFGELTAEFSDSMRTIAEEDLFSSLPKLITTWDKIFDSFFASGVQNEIAEKMERESFYIFGKYLHECLLYHMNGVKNIVYGYLNLFRLSPFLVRIYGETKWEPLVRDLIELSNFNMNALFEQRVNQYKEKPLFKILEGDNEYDIAWQQVKQDISGYRKMFTLLFEKHGHGKVAFLLENSLAMAELDLTCLTSGIINVMIPANSVPGHVKYILNQSEAPIIFVSNEKQLSKVKSVLNELLHLEAVVLLEGASSDNRVYSIDDLQKEAAEKEEYFRETVIRDDATIMYTSGTTGEPKGIIFSQMNIVYKRFCRAMAIPGIGDEDRYLSFLPLFHTFGRYLEMTGAVFWGATYAFMENPSAETMIHNMRKVKPTIFISIPKKWSQLYDHIAARCDMEMDEEEKIKEAVHSVTGGELKWGLSAAGFLPPEVFTFFQQNGVELMSGFGMTEATGGITMTPPGKYKHNSLGLPLPGIGVRLAGDGEMEIRGDYVMKGYYNQPDEKTFTEDGWFPTGDIMKQHSDGYYEIIDRKKEIYKNIKGETIAPQKIENLFRDFDYVKQVFLAGDHRAFNTVLIYPDYQAGEGMLGSMTPEMLQEYFSTVIVTVNKFLAPYERIVDFRVIERAFDASKGELTPKGTYKRREIEKNFSEVIESMYTKYHTEVYVGEIEVRIPNWFLREKGSLNRDIIAMPDAVSIPKLDLMLKIGKCSGKNLYRVGDYCYEILSPYIDLQQFLINPAYWCGNEALHKFAGESIIQWYRQHTIHNKIKFHSLISERIIKKQQRERMLKILSGGEQSLSGVHVAAIMLQSLQAEDAVMGLQYLDIILENRNLSFYPVAFNLLKYPNLNDAITVRREMFRKAVKGLNGPGLEELLSIYLEHNYDLIDIEITRTIIDDTEYKGTLYEIENVLNRFIEKIPDGSDPDKTPVGDLLTLLSDYGINHPTSYEHLRQLYVRHQLNHEWPELAEAAHKARGVLRKGFRAWLGENQRVAVDMETGEEYRWKDVISVDEDVSPEDKETLVNAITKTPIIRESIFLFSNGKLVLLNNILPGGVWISHHRTYPGKRVYRVSVQTRLQGGFDILLHLVDKTDNHDVVEEVNWLVLAGSRHYMQELVEDFGGYWEEFKIWSAKFTPGEPVSRYLLRETRRRDSGVETKLRNLWPFFVWNASAAFFNFWKLTGYRLQLADTTIDNYIIPTHDYQTGTKVVSLSERVPFTSIKDMFSTFYDQFINKSKKEFEFLQEGLTYNYVFSGLINAEGESKGLEILREYREELKDSSEERHRKTLEFLDQFLANVTAKGFIPKQIYFAIKRFHRWYELNNDASLKAQAEMLRELYDTYHLPTLEKSYPETRTRFFLETAFKRSSEELRGTLLDILKKQHNKEIDIDEARTRFTNIKSEFRLTDKEEFFITRLSYPHVKPQDYAALIRTKADDTTDANLVVQYEDHEGIPFYIRKPVSPKEISRLHQLFMETNLMVNFRPEHQFLVAVSERGFLIGGLFYKYQDNETVHMDKIVVSNRYRRKGISDKLMNELFERVRSEGIKYVTTGFFRPEYFYRFDFNIESKYSGLVKEL